MALTLALLAPLPAAAGTVECLSSDGQLRIDFRDGAAEGVTIRIPASGTREAVTMRFAPGDYALEILSEGNVSVRTEGCANVNTGAVAIVRTLHIRARRVRLTLPGGAFPEDVVDRTAEGDGIERDLTCTEERTTMDKCP